MFIYRTAQKFEATIRVVALAKSPDCKCAFRCLFIYHRSREYRKYGRSVKALSVTRVFLWARVEFYRSDDLLKASYWLFEQHVVVLMSWIHEANLKSHGSIQNAKDLTDIKS